MGVATCESRISGRVGPTGTSKRGATARAALAVLCVSASLAVSGCGSISEKIGSTVAETPLVGLPAGTPERPATQSAYPAVHDMPPARPAARTASDQIKMEDELVAARNRQQTVAGQPPSPPPASYAPTAAPQTKKLPAPQPSRAAPTASSSSIY